MAGQTKSSPIFIRPHFFYKILFFPVRISFLQHVQYFHNLFTTNNGSKSSPKFFWAIITLNTSRYIQILCTNMNNTALLADLSNFKKRRKKSKIFLYIFPYRAHACMHLVKFCKNICLKITLSNLLALQSPSIPFLGPLNTSQQNVPLIGHLYLIHTLEEF